MNKETNSLREKAVLFLQLVASRKVKEAFEGYIDESFYHHNPYFPGDSNSLMKAMIEDAVNNPQKNLDIKQTIEENDKVMVHSHLKQNKEDLGWALIHIFRFMNGKIVELWDLSQAVPENSPNQHGLF